MCPFRLWKRCLHQRDTAGSHTPYSSQANSPLRHRYHHFSRTRTARSIFNNAPFDTRDSSRFKIHRSRESSGPERDASKVSIVSHRRRRRRCGRIDSTAVLDFLRRRWLVKQVSFPLVPLWDFFLLLIWLSATVSRDYPRAVFARGWGFVNNLTWLVDCLFNWRFESVNLHKNTLRALYSYAEC